VFESFGNHLYFNGNSSDDPLPVIGRLHNLVHKQGFDNIILDFKQSGFLTPAFMLPVVTTCRAYRRK
jgi:hypothetical protein